MTRGVLPNHPWITIMRPAVCILTVFGAFVGALLVTVPRGDPIDWIKLIIALVGAWAVAMSTQVTNDVADRRIDAIQKPDRPIPVGKIQAKDALAVGIGGYILAIVCGFLVSFELGVIYLCIDIISIHYNYRGKGWPLVGNIEVALCVAMIPVFGAASQGRPGGLWFLFAFIFIFEIGRELIVTAQDVEADREMGLKTLPVYIGKDGSMVVAQILYMISQMFVLCGYHIDVPGFGKIFVAGSCLLVTSLMATGAKVALEDYAFEAYETWIRTRGRFFILLYQFVLLAEVFW